jgi:hypothetical protein
MTLPEGVDEIRLFGRTMDLLMEAEVDLTVLRNDGTAITIPVALLEEIRIAGQGVLGGGSGNFHINFERIERSIAEPTVLAGINLDVRVNGARIANLVEEFSVEAAAVADELTDDDWETIRAAYGNPSVERLRATLTDPKLIAFIEMLTYEELVALGEALQGDSLTHFENALTLSISLEDAAEGINYHRLTAVDGEGNRIAGHFDPATGAFSFGTYTTGTFTVEYAENLRRVMMNLSSPILTDLAQETSAVMDVLPVVQQGRTLLPLRFVAELLGAQVSHARTPGEPMTIFITLDGETLQFNIGEAAPGMDVPAQLIGGRTMVPLRFVTEHFGATIFRDGADIEIVR